MKYKNVVTGEEGHIRTEMTRYSLKRTYYPKKKKK
jgi:hypothetical protein